MVRPIASGRTVHIQRVFETECERSQPRLADSIEQVAPGEVSLDPLVSLGQRLDGL